MVCVMMMICSLKLFINRCGYLMFTKQTERCPNGKRITLTAKVWAAVQGNMEKVKEGLSTETEMKIHISGDKYLILQKFLANGLWYVGVHDVTPSGSIVPFSGLNFDTQEWERLCGCVDQINAFLKLNPGKAIKRTVDGLEVRSDEIVMYGWKWVVGKKKIGESKMNFFDEKTCQADAVAHKPVRGTDYSDEKRSPNVIIEKVTTTPPCKLLHMRQVYITILRRMIKAIMQENCEGCMVGSLSQVDHSTGKGCLAEGINYINEYLSAARQRVETSAIITLFDASRKGMGATPVFAGLLAEAVQYYLSSEACIDLLNNPNVTTSNLDVYLEAQVNVLYSS